MTASATAVAGGRLDRRRVTWRQLHEAGAAVASDLAALLLRADQPPGGV